MQLIPRIVKFRAWIETTKMMIEAVYVFNQIVFNRNDQVIDNAIPMQFIGLPDKNGKEIYEYDIVKTTVCGKERIGIIKYSSKWATFYFACKNDHNVGIGLDSVHQWYYSPDDDSILAEVIGNVFENKELIPCD